MKTTLNPNSIVDTLKSQGKDSSFASRKILAEQQGISGYTGTAQQNTTLNRAIQQQKSIMQTTDQQTRSDGKNVTTLNEAVGSIAGIPGQMQGNRFVPSTNPQVNPQNPQQQGQPQNPQQQGQPQNPQQNPLTVAPGQMALGTDKKEYLAKSPDNLSFTLPPVATGSKRLFGVDGSIFIDDGKGNVSVDQQAQDAKEAVQREDEQYQYRMQKYDQMKATLDIAHQNLVSNIQTMGERQRVEMKDLNQRTLGLKQVAGFRTGSTEFTPEIGMGILRAEEDKGLSRLADIDARTNLLIAEALDANAMKNMGLLQKKIDDYNKTNQEKKEVVKGIYKSYMDFQKFLDDGKMSMMKQEELAQNMEIDKAVSIAPSALTSYEKLTTEQSKIAFTQSLAQRFGITPEILKSQLDSALANQKTARMKAVGKGSGTGKTESKMIVDSWVSKINKGSATIAQVPSAFRNAVILELDKTGAEAENGKFFLDPTGGVDPKYSRRGKLKNEKEVTKVARELETVGIKSEMIIKIQELLSSGVSKEKLFKNYGLNSQQISTLENYIVEL